MVNYKRVVCEVVVLIAVLTVTAAAPAPDCDHYDQRQNGTDNYRMKIDGLVIAIAPADSLLEAAADFTDTLDLSDFDILGKPPGSDSSPSKPADSKPEKPVDSPLSDVSLTPETKPQKKDTTMSKQDKVKRLKHRLSNILIPLLKRTRQQ